MTPTAVETCAVDAGDGHKFDLILVAANAPWRALLWLPALGTAARHYLPFAQALAARGVSVALHEWRGHGSSNIRASRRWDWGYRALLASDLAAATCATQTHWPSLPLAIGGHSLGGQLAACHLALTPRFDALWLVASGAPYWRAFPRPLRYGLPLAYRFLPWLARVNGALPGRRIGFGGNEAAGVMRDWARTALSGRYAVRDWLVDIEHALAAIDAPVNAVTLADDWLAPSSSLDFLSDKMPRASTRMRMLDSTALGTPADHFKWMQAPDAVVDALLDNPSASRP